MSHNKVALVVGAHPDDCEFAAGGATALLISQGWTVHFAIATDGSKGSRELEASQQTVASLREGEQQAAAQLLGVKSVHFLRYEDGEICESRQLLEEIVRLLRTLKPERVFTHYPASLEYWGPNSDPQFPAAPPRVSHRDHRVIGQAVMDAVYPAARDCRNFPEHIHQGLEVHHVHQLYLWGHPQPNEHWDVSEVWEQKIQGLQAHRSQMPQDPKLAERWFERWQHQGRVYEHFLRVELS